RPARTNSRIASAVGVPPGSRVTTTALPSPVSRAARRFTWVDFPVPSPPSKVMNFPAIPGFKAGRTDLSKHAGLGSAARPPPEEKLAQAIVGALRQRADRHVVRGVERRLADDGVGDAE